MLLQTAKSILWQYFVDDFELYCKTYFLKIWHGD